MANVPYDPTPDVAPRGDAPIPFQRDNSNVIAGAFDKVATGLKTVGNVYDQTVTDDAFNQFETFGITQMRGDPNNSTIGYLGTNGRAAMDAEQPTWAAIEAEEKRIASTLKSPTALAAFQARAARYKNDLRAQIGSHAASQSEVWSTNVANSSAQLAINRISANPDDPVALASAAADLRNARIKQAQLAGAQPGDAVWTAQLALADREFINAQIAAVGTEDPERALRIAEKNRAVLGDGYDGVVDKYRARADEQTGDRVGTQTAARYMGRVGSTTPTSNNYTDPSQPIYQEAVTAAPGGYSAAGLARLIQIESAGNPNAVSPSGHRIGLAQFDKATAQEVGLTDRNDPNQSIIAAQKLAAKRGAYLKSFLGRQPTDAELYLAHQQGAGGAKVLLSNPDMSAVDALAMVYKGPKARDRALRAVVGNGGRADMTSAEFVAMWANKFGEPGGPQSSAPTTQPQDALPAAPGVGSAYFDVQTAKAEAYRDILQNPDLSIDARRYAIAAMNQQFSLVNDYVVAEKGRLDTTIQNAPVAFAQFGRYDGDMPTERQFNVAYGADGPQKYAAFKASVEVGQQAYNFRTLSTAEIQAAVEAATPTSAGDDVALQTERYALLADAAEKAIAARNKDPAAYTMSAFPTVGKMWEEAGNDPAKRATALAAMASAQTTLGIENPQLLPQDVALKAAATFKDDTLTAPDRINAVTSLLAQTPDEGQQRAIYDQLVKAGIPNYTQGAIAAMMRGDEGAANTLMRAALVDPSKLTGKFTDEASVAKVSQAFQPIFDEGSIGDIIYGTTDGSTESFERASADMTLMQRAAQLRMIDGSAGDDINKAVALTIKDMFGDVKPVVGDGIKITLPADEDPEPIRVGLRSLEPTVREALRQSLIGGEVPAGPDADGTQAIIAAAVDNNIDMVMAEGYFTNAGTDEYQFFNPFTGTVIGSADGEPLIFSKEDVLAAGANVPQRSFGESFLRGLTWQGQP